MYSEIKKKTYLMLLTINNIHKNCIIDFKFFNIQNNSGVARIFKWAGLITFFG
jgi:hypothetical protein